MAEHSELPAETMTQQKISGSHTLFKHHVETGVRDVYDLACPRQRLGDFRLYLEVSAAVVHSCRSAADDGSRLQVSAARLQIAAVPALSYPGS